MADPAHGAVSEALEDVEEAAEWSAQGQFEQSKRWRGLTVWLGVPAAVTAAVAGATALASTTGRFAAGILALVAAGSSAVLSALNPARRAESARTAGNRYLSVQHDAKVARLVDLPQQDFESARQVLGELMSRADEINAEAPAISRAAYKRAGKNIADGGQTFKTDHRRDDQIRSPTPPSEPT